MANDHYFAAEPASPSRPSAVTLQLPGLQLELVTDRGVFAYGHVDRGTELLLRTVPEPPHSGDLLDLGCGYGPVAVTIARRAPRARVWAIDVNRRALDLCRGNAARNGAANVATAAPDEVPEETRFAALYCNPPIRLGKHAVRDLLTSWLARLLPDASAFLVVQRYMGSDSLAAWLVESGFDVARLRSRSGYRVFEVHSAHASTHDAGS